MPAETLIVLAEVSYHFGLIGLDEYIERCEVARWLDDESPQSIDPREPTSESGDSGEGSVPRENGPGALLLGHNTGVSQDPGILRFVFMGKWYFTIADPDCCPSTPHGHFQIATRRWAKLNPYTGRAFREKHQEDQSMRLDKVQMRVLWRDQAFREFCRNNVLWYMERFPYHAFPTSRPLRLPRW